MKLESQVCNLELSKRLKELGVEQESLFVWTTAFMMDREHQRVFVEYIDTFLDRSIKGEQIICSAFTAAELGTLLPDGVMDKRKFDGRWYSYMENPNVLGQASIGEDSESEADARAKMLIYLLEKGLVKL